MDTDTLPTNAAAAQARAGGVRAPADRPRNRRSTASPGSAARVRAQLHGVNVRAEDGEGGSVGFDGYASVTETAYEMWDFYGPYSEELAASAFDVTLSRSPDVVFLLNHGGMSLARTTSGTLRLSADDTGLLVDADLDPANSVVRDIASGLRRGDLDEMSFAFRITRGTWSPDYLSYRIEEVDIDRGDVSVVNFGANPHTSGQLRSAEILAGLDGLSLDELARAEAAIAHRRSELAPPAVTHPLSPADVERIAQRAQRPAWASRLTG
jgi:HK97 family phage prohead protease